MSIQSILKGMQKNVELYKNRENIETTTQDFYTGYEKAIKDLEKLCEEKSYYTIIGYITAVQEFVEKMEK